MLLLVKAPRSQPAEVRQRSHFSLAPLPPKHLAHNVAVVWVMWIAGYLHEKLLQPHSVLGVQGEVNVRVIVPWASAQLADHLAFLGVDSFPALKAFLCEQSTRVSFLRVWSFGPIFHVTRRRCTVKVAIGLSTVVSVSIGVQRIVIEGRKVVLVILIVVFSK